MLCIRPPISIASALRLTDAAQALVEVSASGQVLALVLVSVSALLLLWELPWLSLSR